MEVTTIAAKYGGLPSRVVARAEENWRLTRAKKSAGLDPFAGPVACIVVAARAMEEVVDRKRLTKCAGATTRLVDSNVHRVLDAVGVRTVVKTSLSALCIKFGCEALTEIVDRVLNEYRAYLAQVAAANRRKRHKHPLGPAAACTNEEDPVFTAACLFAVSKVAKIHIKQEKLLEAVCGNAKAFDAIVSSIETQCQTSLSGAILDRKKFRRYGRERAAEELVEQYQREQLEDEERLKRQKTRADGEKASSPMTLVQQLLVQTSQCSAATAQNPDLSKGDEVATPEEYAEWRTMALEFMRNKKDQEMTKSQGT